MSVEEHNLRLLVIDGQRIIMLDGKKSEELRGSRLHAALRFLNASTRWVNPPERKHVEPPARTPVADKVSQPERIVDVFPEAFPDVITPEVRKRYEAEDVITPAPERVHRMPKGIKRRVTGRNHYPDGTLGRAVLRTVAEFDRPVLFNEVRDRIWQQPVPAGKKPMPQGTVSSQLHQLADAGYLLKEKNVTKHALIYTLTDAGAEILTRPEQQPALDLRPMEGSA